MSSHEPLYVIKRDGSRANVDFNAINERLIYLCENVEPKLKYPEIVDTQWVTQKVINGIKPGIKTTELDTFAAETSAALSTQHPDYKKLAARIEVSNLQKQAPKNFFEAMRLEWLHMHPKIADERAPLIDEAIWKIIEKNADRLNAAIKPERDFLFDFFGFKTLEQGYLVKVDGGTTIVETPQYMFLRVAIGIHGEDLDSAIETYDWMSQKLFTHATPTLFNAGTPVPQMSSCFLLCMKEDSIEGIYDTLKNCSLISKSAGGIGLSVHNIRAADSFIKGTNGRSNGIIPMLKVFNDTARYVDQGGGKRKGAFAIYLEPWHADIEAFLELKKNNGKEEIRARDLFYALWIPDLFMKRVENNESWSLFCPNEAKGLHDIWGQEFEDLYLKYEKTPGLARKTIRAQDLWFSILESQIETGVPYMLYKDAVNRKTNHQHLGTIKSSNLCTEIAEFTAPDEIAVCNLASISLPAFISNGQFDFEKLGHIVKIITKNLNKIIDSNFYPVEEARNSNMRHRPIGIGVQGLADLFIKLRMPFESEEAAELNKEIFATIYYYALSASMELAKRDGPYVTFPGSPLSKGILQFDMWGVTPSKRYDWGALRQDIVTYGTRNSLLVAPMPTASTSQILGNQEGTDPYTSNAFLRRTKAGEFVILNEELIADLMKLGLWTEKLKNQIVDADGSIQGIDGIPDSMKKLYKTVWEISQARLIQMSADRGAYICQSQSFNCYFEQPGFENLSTFHFMGWKKGLKTGMYYLRRRPVTNAVKFTTDVKPVISQQQQKTSQKLDIHIEESDSEFSEFQQRIEKMKKTKESMESEKEEAFVCRKEQGCWVCDS